MTHAHMDILYTPQLPIYQYYIDIDSRGATSCNTFTSLYRTYAITLRGSERDRINCWLAHLQAKDINLDQPHRFPGIPS
jgi:hypothetical protein